MPTFTELPQQITELECSKIILINHTSYEDHVTASEFSNLTNCFVKVICSPFAGISAIDAVCFQIPDQDYWIPEFTTMKEITQQWPDSPTIHLHIDIFYSRFQRFLDWIHNNPNTNDYIADYKLHLLNIVHDE